MANDTNKLRTLDLFSGIGGISLALQPWCKTVCFCEIDPYAAGVLIANMAKGNIDTAPIWSDVRTFGQPEIDQVGPIECVTGGFPCQDISCAGKRVGITGERSGLFFEIIRIIRLARPRIIFLENVPAITVRGLGTVLGELAESGYYAKWRMLSAAEIGATHLRNRWWLVAYAKGYRMWRKNGNDRGKRGADRFINSSQVLADTKTPGLERADRTRAIRSTRCTAECFERDWWTTEPDVGRVADGVSDRVDRLKCLGNSVVPACARKAFEILTERKP